MYTLHIRYQIMYFRANYAHIYICHLCSSVLQWKTGNYHMGLVVIESNWKGVFLYLCLLYERGNI